jgi:pyrroline-5-carboxylate reductase
MTSEAPPAPFELIVVGGGNMGAALIGGLLDAAVLDPSSLAVVEVVESRRHELVSLFPTITVTSDVPATRAALLAVKPADVAVAASSVVAAGATRVLSIAAGVRLATIEAAVGPGVAVVRAMPNTPALVRLGASAIAGGSAAGDDDVAWAESILSAVGTVERMSESDLDLFTGVAGSGPAYVFLVAEALTEAAVAEGMSRPVAERVIRQLLLGSATLLDREGDPAQLRERVTSPGGTTAAGLAVLADLDVRGAFAAAVRAATERSRELG